MMVHIGDMVHLCVQYSIYLNVTQVAFIVACFFPTSYLDKSINHHTTCMYKGLMVPINATWLLLVLIQQLSDSPTPLPLQYVSNCDIDKVSEKQINCG